jgi:HEAT repeat protein
VAEALTIPLDPGATSDPLREVPSVERFVRPLPIHTRTAAGDLRLRLALASFDRARSWEEIQAAQGTVLSLGPDVVPSILAELAKPQPPERFDLLLTLLMKRQTAEEVIELARSGVAVWVLRAALAEALGHYAESIAGAPMTERIASALAQFARDAEPGVRIAAVEAIGLSKLGRDPQAREVLLHVASDDPNVDVKREAATVLAETD